jgi:hypothetical protein
MSGNIIRCPDCGILNNLEVAGRTCWRCARHFQDEDLADRASDETALPGIGELAVAPTIRISTGGELEKMLGLVGLTATLGLLIFVLSRCSMVSVAPVASEIRPVISPFEAATQELDGLSQRLAHANSTCENGATRIDVDGRLALAEVDLAMVDNIDSISPAQEQRIRESIGSEMGLPPSRVDGWRSIYRSRAEQAKRLLTSADEDTKHRQQAACAERSGLKLQVARAKSDVARLRPS